MVEMAGAQDHDQAQAQIGGVIVQAQVIPTTQGANQPTYTGGVVVAQPQAPHGSAQPPPDHSTECCLACCESSHTGCWSKVLYIVAASMMAMVIVLFSLSAAVS